MTPRVDPAAVFGGVSGAGPGGAPGEEVFDAFDVAADAELHVRCVCASCAGSCVLILLLLGAAAGARAGRALDIGARRGPERALRARPRGVAWQPVLTLICRRSLRPLNCRSCRRLAARRPHSVGMV